MFADTDLDAETLCVVECFLGEHGYSPSVRDVQEALGLRSASSAHHRLIRLRDKGLIQWDKTRRRTIRLA